MIKYNMRYRGPYEYDKYALNILQFHNEVNRISDKLTRDSNSSLKKLTQQLDEKIKAMQSYQQKISIMMEVGREI